MALARPPTSGLNVDCRHAQRDLRYYLTPHDDALYIATFEHEDPAHPGGLWRLRKR
jgi:hypothetical protein